MAHVTILGAGDMGAALVTPLTYNGHQVRLWGTERDGTIVAALRSGLAHPRLGVTVPEGVQVLPAAEAASALRDTEIVVVAITSDAVRAVLNQFGSSLADPVAIVTVAKGFDGGRDGRGVQLLPATIAEYSNAPVVAVGGPSKANEVATGQPTAVVFGSLDNAALSMACAIFSTPQYRIELTEDITGLEVAAAMKNAYAIALGITDGLEQRRGLPHHNLRAALFPRAVAEMGALARALGGRTETVLGLAGIGDLQVTITSGRNRLLGERIGGGENPAAAVRALTSGGTTVEGYPAADFGHRLYRQAIDLGRLREGSLP
ncbi:MAG: NAD(P)-binding domain-containing protein, partial [Chloroflexia bacterium]|nr:NAD(P)-binding domain-containing protein [Chloroflexia bacterium]